MARKTDVSLALTLGRELTRAVLWRKDPCPGSRLEVAMALGGPGRALCSPFDLIKRENMTASPTHILTPRMCMAELAGLLPHIITNIAERGLYLGKEHIF